jgi:heme/copper-type cytochrome/quinol oxidase subunit 2
MSIATVVLTETVHARELPFEAWVYGVIALVVFAALGFVLWSYRDVANRHSTRKDGYGSHLVDDVESGSH